MAKIDRIFGALRREEDAVAQSSRRPSARSRLSCSQKRLPYPLAYRGVSIASALRSGFFAVPLFLLAALSLLLVPPTHCIAETTHASSLSAPTDGGFEQPVFLDLSVFPKTPAQTQPLRVESGKEIKPIAILETPESTGPYVYWSRGDSINSKISLWVSNEAGGIPASASQPYTAFLMEPGFYEDSAPYMNGSIECIKLPDYWNIQGILKLGEDGELIEGESTILTDSIFLSEDNTTNQILSLAIQTDQDYQAGIYAHGKNFEIDGVFIYNSLGLYSRGFASRFEGDSNKISNVTIKNGIWRGFSYDEKSNTVLSNIFVEAERCFQITGGLKTEYSQNNPDAGDYVLEAGAEGTCTFVTSGEIFGVVRPKTPEDVSSLGGCYWWVKNPETGEMRELTSKEEILSRIAFTPLPTSTPAPAGVDRSSAITETTTIEDHLNILPIMISQVTPTPPTSEVRYGRWTSRDVYE